MIESSRLVQQLVAEQAAARPVYSPTETTIYAPCGLVDRDAPVTVDNPLLNSAMLIVDQHDVPVPDGTTGELLIAGDGVTRGYLYRDERPVSATCWTRTAAAPGCSAPETW